MKKTKKVLLRQKKLKLAAVIAVGFSMFLLGSSFLFYQKTVLSFNNFEQSSSPPVIQIQKNSLPVKIEIPVLNLALQIDEGKISENGIWEISENGASFLTSSGQPGSNTNTVIYGHNKNHLFGPLTQIKTDDEIILQSEDGVQHKYQVTETKIVTPDRVEEVMPTEEEILTVYTCTGWLDSKRFVVKAKPVVLPL